MTAKEIAERVGRNVIIGIAGASSSGKTTLARRLAEALKPGAEVVPEVARYYHEHHPTSADGALRQYFFLREQMDEELGKSASYPVTLTDSPALTILAHSFRAGHSAEEAEVLSSIVKRAWQVIPSYWLTLLVETEDIRLDGVRDRGGVANSRAVYSMLRGLSDTMNDGDRGAGGAGIVYLGRGTIDERLALALAAIQTRLDATPGSGVVV
jgi:energy-coupling factor transporter ATP-binding protein EcfA2